MIPYKALLRPLLLTLPPEKAHRLGEFVLKRQVLWKLLAPYYATTDPRLKTSLAGIELSNPVGVAAGCDKDCEFLPSLMNLGFGYVVGGTVTLEARAGNPSPRVIRNVRQRSLVNALGFPGKGAEAILKNLQKAQIGPLAMSVAGLTVEEFIQCLKLMEPWAQSIELNVSSPNTAGLRVFLQPENFQQLLERVNATRKKPLFVKLPPYGDDAGRERVLGLVGIARRLGINGITAANTRPVQESRLRVGSGGLSGRPLFQDMLRMVADLRREAGSGMAISACGGISSSDDAVQALKQGADTVQLYTGLIYEGPGIARSINRGLSRYLNHHGLKSVRELTGA